VIRRAALAAALLFGFTLPAPAQRGLGNAPRLTVYGSAAHWGSEGDVVGGGLGIERPVGGGFELFSDIGAGRLVSGCPPELPAACPRTAWHMLGGIRWSLRPARRLAPFLGLALGRQDLIQTTSVLRGEVGATLPVGPRFLLRAGAAHTRSLRGRAARIWGGYAGIGFPLGGG
jgi:hypothetical protein